MRWRLTDGTVVRTTKSSDGAVRIVNLNGNVLALDRCGAEWLNDLITRPDILAAKAGAKEFIASLRVARVVEPVTFRSRTRLRLQHIVAKLCVVILYPIASFLPPVVYRIGLLMVLTKALIYLLGWKTLVDSIASSRSWLCRFPGLVNQYDYHELESLLMQASSQCVVGVACKERAILFFLMNLRDWPRVKVIVAFQWAPLGGHSWCQIDDAVFTDPDNLRLQGFETICALPQ